MHLVADSTSIQKLVREIHRRRMLGGDMASITQTVSEVAVFVKYNRQPTINDMHFKGKSMYLTSLDDDDLSFMVVPSKEGKSWEVDPSLQHNTYIFVHGISSTESDIVGWMPREEIVHAPKGADGKVVVTRKHFFKMPETYAFQPPCPTIPCNESAIWDYDTDSWDCFGSCNKHRYESEDAITW